MEHDAIIRHRMPALSIPAGLAQHGQVFALGFGCWIVSVGLYAAYGFSLGGFVLWVFSFLWVSIGLYLPGRLLRRPARRDVLIGLGLLALFLPLYMLLLYEIPFQVGFDEISVMVYEKIQLQRPLNLFGISEYASFPAAMFYAFAWLGEALGGITLQNMRMIHASSGLLIIVLSFVYFRQFLPQRLAAAGAIVLGSNHAFLAISRMGQWDNSAVLFELLAFVVLVKALDRKSWLLAFVGGLVAGLTFYVYFPSRVTFPIWIAALTVLAIYGNHRLNRREIIQLGSVTTVGFAMVVAPVLISTFRNTRIDADYSRRQLLIFPAGRALQRNWMRVETEAEGVWINITHGLTTFNNLEHDQGFVYPNRGHGFLDPLSGVLLWGGVWVLLKRIKERRLFDLVTLIGFGVLWLFFSFVVNQAPNYTRLLVTLPFVAFFVVVALDRISISLAETLRVPSRHVVLFAAGVVAIVVWNLSIYSDFLTLGLENGDLNGATTRYIDRRTDIDGYEFHLMASEQYPFYHWGDAAQWLHWIGTFIGDDQEAEVTEPLACIDLECVRPFTAFMSDTMWLEFGPQMTEAFPDLVLHSLLPNGTRLAIEVGER